MISLSNAHILAVAWFVQFIFLPLLLATKSHLLDSFGINFDVFAALLQFITCYSNHLTVK